MKIFKKSISLGFIFLIFLGIFIPSTQAIQFGGTSTPQIPAVINRETNEGIWSFNNSQISNGIISLLCVGGLNQENGECQTYLAQLSMFFVIDTTKPSIYEYVEYTFQGSTLRFYAYTHEEDPEHVFFAFVSYNGDVKITEGSIAKIRKDAQCGTVDTNICVVAFNPYLYLIATDGISGVYMPFIDMLKYSDENNAVVFTRKFFDGSSGNEHRTLYESLISMFNNYKGSYGQFLMPMRTYGSIWYIPYGIGNNFFIYFNNDGGSGRFVNYTSSTAHNRYTSFPTATPNVFYGNLSNLEAVISTPNNIWFRDFLVGNENPNLIYNLRDFFGVTNVDSAIAGTGATSNPDNWNGETQYNCETTDIGCHIKSLGNSIVNGFGSVFTGIFDFFGSFFENLFRGIKGIFVWIYNTIINIINSILTPLFDFFSPIYDDIIKPVFDFFFGFFKPIWQLATGEITYQSLIWGNQEYLCSKNRGFYIDTETSVALKPSELLGFFLFLANPLPPPDNSLVCTSLGMKDLDYGRSTFIDATLFLIFFASGVWFLLFIVRK